MNLQQIKKIELEISSNCNAACPGCARTQYQGDFSVENITLEQIKNIFPDRESIVDKNFKLCGVLGDPIINKDCLEIVRYIVANDGYCQLSTNAGLRDAEFWTELGVLSKYTNRVDVNFCIDGHRDTNHIYRIGTDWAVIERNLEAYCSATEYKPAGTWVYIVFDHNEHELETAQKHAERLGLQFATRTGMRNSLHNWVSDLKRKNKETKQVEYSTQVITTSGAKEHSKKAIVAELDNFIKLAEEKKNRKAPPPNITFMLTEEDAYEQKKQEIVSSIKCKLYHERELFIASNMTVWPCCFLWDNMFRRKEQIVDKLGIFDEEWNSLKKHSIDEILEHPWFDHLLRASWDPDHPLHFNRCIRTCAYNKAYQNEFNYKDKK
jgi:MoaA/NifB/PqqE/SkfB family radical SAM enzyme